MALPAFGLSDELPPFDSDWHQHSRHQVLYACAGTMHLEVEGSQWLLLPQKAAWIHAGTTHRVRSKGPLSLRSVYLDADRAAAITVPCGVFSVTPLAREMLLHAMRWGPDREGEDAVAAAFFAAMGALLPEWVRELGAFRLPTARTPELARAMHFALENLDGPCSIEEAARAAHLSSRTLARRFEAETGMTWRSFLHDARMLRAMDLLAQHGSQVTQVAYAVGFGSLAAFSRAFQAFAGEGPRDFRQRILDHGAASASKLPTSP